MSKLIMAHAAAVAYSMVQLAKRIEDEDKRTIALIEGGSIFVSLIDENAFKEGESSLASIWAAAITGISQDGLIRFAGTQLKGASRIEETGCGMCPKCKAKGIKVPKEIEEVIELLRNLGDVEIHFIDIGDNPKSKFH